MTAVIPQAPFGAVYFRKSNPPRDDWDRDYRTAAEDGLNVFRHWFLWSAIERAPGVFDWDDYDRQFDLAEKHGLKTIIAELTQAGPDWAVRRFAQARQIRFDGRMVDSTVSPSAAVGGFARNGGGAGTLTFNSADVREAAGNFLTQLAERYKGHPALLGYDVWNECNYSPIVDFSEPSKAAFRRWLEEKYGDLDRLAHAWHRYSYADWDDIEPPHELRPYQEGIDWIRFNKANHYEQLQFRIDTIRAVDPDVLIAAHGVAGAVSDMASRGCDDWLAASKVDVYGYTWVPARKGAQPWRNFYASDLIRGASRGKPFWHAERQGGPLWMQPQVLGRDKEDGRVAEPEDVRLWSLTSFAGGARGMMNLRFRPLLDGPLFGAFGSYGMDGRRTDRSDMAGKISQWLNAPEQGGLIAASPIKGDIGIVLSPDVQEYDYLLSAEGGFTTYRDAMWGSYRGFFDNNIQADWVHIDDIAGYDTLYFPYPIMLTPAQAQSLSAWVEGGGVLISEACPGYFGTNGRVGTVQPNNGLHELFGAREDDVEFMPDIADRTRLRCDGLEIACGGYLQSYRPEGGVARGYFLDGRVAMVENRYGLGRTLLIGTHHSVGYHTNVTDAGRRFFNELFEWTGRAQSVRINNPTVQARLHTSDDATFVWIVNPTRSRQTGTVRFAEGTADVAKMHWQAPETSFDGSRFDIAPRDLAIARIRMKPS